MNIFKQKKVLSLLLAIAVCFSILAVPSLEVQAASPKFEKKISLNLYEGIEWSPYKYITNPTTKGKISNVKSSNTKVVKAYKASHSKSAIALTPIKAGTAKISFKYAGKKYTSTITVKNWENPFESFSIGNKDYTSKFDKSGAYNLYGQKKNLTGKINITAKKGWQLKKITVNCKTVKNKSKIKLDKRGTPGMSIGSGVVAYLYNKKTKKTYLLYFDYTGIKDSSGNYYF